MALKAESSVLGGLAVAAVVFAIHSNFTPTQADMSGLPATATPDLDKSERQATYLSAGVVAGISLIAHDPTIFVIGSAATIAMAWFTRHSVWTTKAGTVGMPANVSTAPTVSAPQISDSTAYAMYGAGAVQSQFVSS